MTISGALDHNIFGRTYASFLHDTRPKYILSKYCVVDCMSCLSYTIYHCDLIVVRVFFRRCDHWYRSRHAHSNRCRRSRVSSYHLHPCFRGTARPIPGLLAPCTQVSSLALTCPVQCKELKLVMAPILPSSLSPHICILQSPDLQQVLTDASLPSLPQILQSFSPLSQG